MSIVAEPNLDAIAVEDSQGDGCFSYSTSASESDRIEAVRETNDRFN